jgi:Stage II sporulation protein E (SpoIIE)
VAHVGAIASPLVGYDAAQSRQFGTWAGFNPDRQRKCGVWIEQFGFWQPSLAPRCLGQPDSKRQTAPRNPAVTFAQGNSAASGNRRSHRLAPGTHGRGDHFDVLRLDGNRLAICIADVSGKGVSAALLMANVQASLRASVRDLDSPARVCGIVNGMLCEIIAANKFVTFFCSVLDANTRTFRYCSAGHPYPILASTAAAHTLDQGGAVLGVFPSWNYEDSSVDLKSGDRLLLFTDGITEAEDAQGEEFGVERVAAFGKAHAASSAAESNEQLLTQVSDFCAAQFQDDATLVVLAVG